MKVEFIYPKSDLLKKHISCFYFYRPEKEVNFVWTAFPTTFSIVTFYNHAKFVRQNGITLYSDTSIPNFQSRIIGRYIHPLSCHYQGLFDEITICFKPLGFAYFFDKPFAETAPHDEQEFLPGYDDWNELIQNLYGLKEIESRIELLENYLTDKYRDAKLEIYQPIVEKLLDVEENLSITKIVQKSNVSQKTIERVWQKHIGCSPATFRRISRFRHVIKLYLAENPKLNLIELCHRCNFFDQPYFNKEFRRLTNSLPKSFFNSTDKFPKINGVWKIS